VLVAGGVSDTAEIYDPATGIWTLTGNLGTARFRHTATLLPNGMVLIAAGLDLSLNLLTSSELYDPALGIFTPTGSLATARAQHTATLMTSGKVLVTGGQGGPTATTEFYDPATGRWIAGGNLVSGRAQHTATLLNDGTLLVAAGYFGNAPSRSIGGLAPAVDHGALNSAEIGLRPRR